MSVPEDIQVVLAADATLMATLTGGVYAAAEITRQDTPAAFDANGEIKPCALVKGEVETPWGPHEHSSRAFIRIFFYQRSGYDDIDTARERVYTLLHRQKALDGKWELLHTDDITGQEDQVLNCSLELSRYQVLRNREPELIQNPSFEIAGAGGADVFANWTEVYGLDGLVEDETVLVHSGSHAMKMTSSYLFADDCTQEINVTPGQDYVLSFWTRGDGTAQGRYGVYDVNGGVAIIPLTATGVTGTTYTKVSANFKAPVANSLIRIIFDCSLIHQGVFYLDDVSVKLA